jgi:hypothetical protein
MKYPRLYWLNAKGELSEDPASLTDRELMSELLHYLNRREESDSGRIFRPNTISSCRVMDGDIIGKVLKEMEHRV